MFDRLQDWVAVISSFGTLLALIVLIFKGGQWRGMIEERIDSIRKSLEDWKEYNDRAHKDVWDSIRQLRRNSRNKE